ncbi:MAG: sporulation protein YabP [Clostridium sp.]|nr:sporulation protein YabP [Clostridium sp.]
MSNEAQHIEHTVSVVDRRRLSLTGITDVDEFNEQEILAVCDLGELSIKGELLHIEELSLETGQLSISGKITSLTYSEKLNSTSLFKRLFGG